MTTKQFIPILAGAMALFTLGCGTMKVTTVASADHPRDLGEPLLLRIAFRDGPSVGNDGAPQKPKPEPPTTGVVILASATP